MSYGGIINVDFNEANSNEQNKLSVALIHAGWHRVETSSFKIEGVTVADVLRGIELVSKQAASIGTLSALTFHVQLTSLTAPGTPKTTLSPVNSFNDIKTKPFP